MTTLDKIFHYAPRLLSLVFVLFLSVFALDVFSTYSGWSVVLPLFMHLIPSLLLLFAIVIAWKHEWVGGVLFLGFAAWYVWSVGLERPWSWYASIAAPAAIVGILFFLSWRQKRSH